MSDSLVRVSRRVEWGARWPTPKSAGATRARPRGRSATLLGHRDDVSAGGIIRPGLGRPRDPRPSTPRVERRTGSRRPTYDRGASPVPIRFPPDNFKHSLTLFSKSFSSFPRGTYSLSVSRRYLALDGIYRPIWAAFPNNPTRRQRLAVRQVPGTTGLSPSLAPHSMGLAPGPSQRTLLQTTIRMAKAARFSYWALPGSLAVTRGILRVFPPDLGSQSEQGLRSRRRLPAGVLFRARASDTTSSHAGPGRAEPPLVVPRCPWGKVFFSQPRQGGQGRPICSPPTTRRTARGGAAGHGVGGEHVGRDAQVTVFEVGRHGHAAGDRLALPLSLGTDRAEWLFVCSRPGPSGAADSEPVGAGHEREARGFDGRFAPGRATVAAGHRVQLVRLGRVRFVESTMILPQVQWTFIALSGGRTANVAAIRTLHRTIQSVGATGGVYKGQGRSQRELMTRAY
ncbi:hypothetical protein H6P81_015959 [Aristolochia fimbriata]|uniref:Protein TAR1 n=1 Tax=Aristolochia fimbriata TaxID=158543 RepID=A0AAV7E7B5_ARIFI|nr:hypothetical protein H6P81_015959 [Aristolochia fimbriata]